MSSRARAPDLKGRVVLVTGAGRGLGRALVQRLHARGALVAGCSRSGSDLDSLTLDLNGVREPPLLMTADVTDTRSVERWVAAARERWGRVDGLINNASVLGDREPLRDVDVEAWRRVIDANLTGAFIACRAVLPAMRDAGAGSIVNVSSGVGNRPRESWGAYAVSKWALEAFSWNLALEERSAGIRVNVVDPGAMRTEMRHAAYPSEDPTTLPAPIDVTDVFLWLMHPASASRSGERFVARNWRAP